MSLNKPLDSIDENDLQDLIDNEVPEGKTIEYKKSLPGNKDKDKKEFLSDVSSFANAIGGDLIFGMIEESGKPTRLCGLQNINLDAEKLRLDNLLRDCIEPRIPGLHIKPVSLQTKGNGEVIIIRIPRSWALPHVAKFGSYWRFCSRNSAGKYPLDVSELRAAFALSEAASERIRKFRTERLSKIVAGETPVILSETAKIILHIMPFSALDTSIIFDVSLLDEQSKYINPDYLGRWSNSSYNFDGFFRYYQDKSKLIGYTQFFRNGSIEVVDLFILDPKSGFIIRNIFFEKELIKAIEKFSIFQKNIGIEPPIFIMVSLLGVSGYTMYLGERYHNDGNPIDRNDLLIPEVVMDDFECSIDKVLKPIFDTVWNATGLKGSYNYDKNKNWIGDKKR